MSQRPESEAESRMREWLVFLMEDRGLSISEMARSLGVSRPGLSLTLSRRRSLRARTVERIITVFGVKPHALIFEVPPKPKALGSRAERPAA